LAGGLDSIGVGGELGAVGGGDELVGVGGGGDGLARYDGASAEPPDGDGGESCSSSQSVFFGGP
jgi:hypothetical protein